MENEEITIYNQWLNEDKMQLKILLYIALNKNRYTNICYCKLKDITLWLGRKSNANTNDKIREVLNYLEKQGYITWVPMGQTLNIKLIELDAEKIKNIKSEWVEAIRMANRDKDYKKINKNISVDWAIAFKIFIHTYNGNFKSVMTQKEIGKMINVSKDTVNDALKLLELCEDKIGFMKEVVKKTNKFEIIKDNKVIDRKWFNSNIGTNLNIKQNFE